MSESTGSKLVAITGGSGAGKSRLADRLHRILGEKAGRLSLDDFYQDRSSLPPSRRADLNFDHPDAIDWLHFDKVLRNCSVGRPIRQPVYDFNTHCRVGFREPCRPRPVMIADGLWLLVRPAVRRIFHLKVFVDCPEKIRMQRRIVRDVAERGRCPDATRRQFEATVSPMHRRHVAPQKRWADVVLHQPYREDEVRRLHESLWNLLQSSSLLPAWMHETFRAELTGLLTNKEDEK